MLLYLLDKSYKTFVLVHPDKCQKDKEHTNGQWRGEIQANNLKKWHDLSKTLEGKKTKILSSVKERDLGTRTLLGIFRACV